MLLIFASCQSFGGEDLSATLSADMTAYVSESADMQSMAQEEQAIARATLDVASTAIAEASNVNMVLAATVRANTVPTQEVRQVVVSVSDMGDSLDTEMMEEGDFMSESDGMEVINVGTASSVRNSDGCSNGITTDFTPDDERIYVTAQVLNLSNGTNFSVDWTFEQRLIYRSTWTSDYSAGSECIWFYMSPDDAPFLPGTYTITLYVNGSEASSQQFVINTG